MIAPDVRSSLLALLCGGMLLSCAPRQSVRWAPGIDMAKKGTVVVPASPNRTVRFENKVRLRSQGRIMNFETIVIADSNRGRMEALGPFGMTLATLVWQDTSWQVWLPSQGTLVKGNGDSFTLPVVGLRTFRPRELVAPYLGRTFGASPGTLLRRVDSDKSSALFIPAQAEPRWAISLDRSTGLPRYRQILRKGSESERFRFGAWSIRQGIPVPDSLVRTGRDSQEVSLRLTAWEQVDSLPASLLVITLEKPVDTILVVRDGAGRQRYRIRPANGSVNTAAAESLLDTLTGVEDSASFADPDDEAPADSEDGLPEDEELLPSD